MMEFSIFTIRGEHKFSIEEENDISLTIYSALLLIFGSVDYDNQIINFCCQQQMNDELLEKIKTWVSTYESVNIQLRKIKSYFESIPNGEYFFVFPIGSFSHKDTIMIFEHLKGLNAGKDLEEIKKQIADAQKLFDEIFSNIFEKYFVSICDTKKRIIYGEQKKEKRRCRYCNKTMSDGVTFSNIAHTVSEALGNKTIISAEECDSCNSRFAETIEKDIINYLHIYRVLFGKKGKSGVPHLKFKNGMEIKYDGEKANIFDMLGASKLEQGNFNVPLLLNDPINFMNIYRALVKFALGVIPVEYLQYYSKTINWLNDIKNDGSKLNLPQVAVLLDNRFYYDQPELITYIQKNSDKKLPFIYAEFKSTFFIFVFIIPFSDKDSLDFSCKENFNYFWQFNKQYSSNNNWVFHDFNIDKDIILTLNLNFKKRE